MPMAPGHDVFTQFPCICYNEHIHSVKGASDYVQKEIVPGSYDRDRTEPVLRCSICTGEQVAGFRDKQTGYVEEVMAIRSPRDLDEFRREYGISEPIEKIY